MSDLELIASLQRELAEAGERYEDLREIVTAYQMPVAVERCLAAHDAKWGAAGPSDAKGEPIPVQFHRRLEAIAESLGVKDWQAAGTSTLATLIAEAVGKLKSTPAEPAQKLVPLPEGARVIVPHDMTAPGFKVAYLNGYWQLLDPALYGVPQAERVRELEARIKVLENDDLGGMKVAEATQRNFALARDEAERLRKAIKTADAHYKGGFSCGHVMHQLVAALTPPTAASGEECGAINPEWLNKMADAEDAAGDISIGTSAPAAESEGGEATGPVICRTCNGFGGFLDDPMMQCPDCGCPSRSALSARLAACEERCKELEAGIRRAHELLGRNRYVSAYDALDTLLAPKAEGGGDGTRS